MIFSKLKYFIISVLVFSSCLSLDAQQTSVYDAPTSFYQQGLQLYQQGQYGAAFEAFNKTLQTCPKEDVKWRTDAEYYQAICAVQLFNDDAELMLENFIINHPENVHIKQIYFQQGVFQYRKKNFKQALKAFEKVDFLDLSSEERVEYNFKKGYSSFQTDDREGAKKCFYDILEVDGKYKAPSVYYYSHIAYLEGNYQTALKGFLQLKDNETFGPVTPYYITHIYYLQQNYDQLLSIAPELLEKSTPQRQPEIARLIGESYFRTGKYEQALPYLKRYYETSNATISTINRYQLGYTYYKMKDFKSAIPHFEAATALEADSLAQSAYYYLASCYVESNEKTFALNAFKKTYQLQFDKTISADALYQFAKLSYELDFNPYNQAVEAFQKYVVEYPNSPHRAEAMTYLTKMYLSTNNYAQALESIEKISDKSVEMNIAYQRILYARGVQFFQQNELAAAVEYFDKAIKVNANRQFTAKSMFWRAESYYRLGIYNASIEAYQKFLTASGAFELDNYNEAYYNLGYAYYKLKDYPLANKNFRIFALNEKQTHSPMYNDVQNRIGDSYFIQSEMALAVDHYNIAIEIGLRDVDYSLFKKAEALGPLVKPQERASTLDLLLQNYPNTAYAGNARYMLAQTYFRQLQQPDKATQEYLNIINTFPAQTSVVKKSKLDLGYLYNNVGKTSEATSILKSVYIDYKGSTESNDAIKTLQGIYTEQGNVDEFFQWVEKQGVQIAASTQDSINFQTAENQYMNENCTQAVESFGRYIERFPAGYFINDAHFYRAECLRQHHQYSKALIDYNYLVSRPVNQYSLLSLNYIANINYTDLKDYQSARSAFARLSTVAESNENQQKALIGIMRCDFYLQNQDSLSSSALRVFLIENLNLRVKREAALHILRINFAAKNQDKAMVAIQQLLTEVGTEEAAEAMYCKAYFQYLNTQYDSAQTTAFKVIQQEPSYEYWVVKSFLLSADIFIQQKNYHQAKATLSSIVDNYEGDKALMEEAKSKLELVKTLMAEGLKKEEPSMENLNFGHESDLFTPNSEGQSVP